MQGTGKREIGGLCIKVERLQGGRSGSGLVVGCPASVSGRCASHSFRERSVLVLKIGAALVDHFLRLEIHAQAGAVHVAIELDVLLIGGNRELARGGFSGKEKES